MAWHCGSLWLLLFCLGLRLRSNKLKGELVWHWEYISLTAGWPMILCHAVPGYMCQFPSHTLQHVQWHIIVIWWTQSRNALLHFMDGTGCQIRYFDSLLVPLFRFKKCILIRICIRIDIMKSIPSIRSFGILNSGLVSTTLICGFKGCTSVCRIKIKIIDQSPFSHCLISYWFRPLARNPLLCYAITLVKSTCIKFRLVSIDYLLPRNL